MPCRASLASRTRLLTPERGEGLPSKPIDRGNERVSIKQLREIVDLIGHKPYFQFVLEVSDLRHEASGTVAKKVEISTDLPPVILDLTPRDLGNPVKKNKK